MRTRVGVLALLLIPGLAAPAAAQSTGFFGGLAGVTFNTVTSGAVGGRGGLRISRELFVFGEVGRMLDVVPSDFAEDIDTFEEFLEAQLGLPVDIRVHVPATYVFGGVRWEARGRGRFLPFAEGGFGIAHMTADIRASIGGLPVPEETVEQFGDFNLESTDPILAVGGGVRIRLTPRVAVDAGYRFTKIFVGDDVPLDSPSVTPNVVYAAVSVAWGR